MYDEKKGIIERNRQKYEKHRTLIEIVQDAEKDREEDCDDIEENTSPYIDEETTAEEDIKDFEKKMKDSAKRVLTNFNTGSEYTFQQD